MICSSASTNDPAAAKVSTTQSQLCKYSSGYPEQLGNAPRSRHSGMSYGSTNGSSNGSLIQHHHHHHDYGYHHHHLGSIRSPTVSSAPDSSFVGQQQDHSHHHQQHLDSCSIHSSAVAAVAVAAAAAAALTTYHHQQHQQSNLHPASTTTDSASIQPQEHTQMMTPTQQSIPQKSKPTPAVTRNHSTRSCRLSSTSSSAKKRKRVATVAQRRAANIRERRRMFNLNEAFDKLRRKVPTFAYEKRLSRIETLRLAITYISFMDQVIRNETNKPANSSSSTGPAASSSQLPAPSGTVDNSYRESTSW